MKEDEVREIGALLRRYADHFVERDWNYTRKHEIKHIRMKGDYSGYDHPWQRVKRWVRQLFTQDSLGRLLRQPIGLRHPIITTRVWLSTDDHLPDGVLDGGNVIVFWEETAEYLQFVQPQVGVLLADFLEGDPTNPHAVAIATRIKVLMDRYSERIENGEVS